VPETIDELGSVDWLVLEFPGSKFNGAIAPVISDLTDRGPIRVLDLLVVKKDADGSFEDCERMRARWPWCWVSRTWPTSPP
jgi:hypothetical protein